MLVTDVLALAAGTLLPRQSVVLVCLVMLAVGLALYFVNSSVQRRLGPGRTAPERP